MPGVSLGQADRKAKSVKAILVFVEDLDEEVWIPTSVIHEDSEVWDGGDGEGELIVEEWFAESRGWV